MERNRKMLADIKIDVNQDYMSKIFNKWISDLDYERIKAGVSRKWLSKNSGISIAQLEKGQNENYASYTLDKLIQVIELLEKCPEFQSPEPGINSKQIKIWASDLERRRTLNNVKAVDVAKALDVDNTSIRYWRERNYLCIKVHKFIELCEYFEKMGVDTRMFK